MTEEFNRKRILVDATEIRRSQHVDVPSITNPNFELHERKGVLKTEIPQYIVTMGLPASRERDGNGVSVVAVSSYRPIFYRKTNRSYTTRVTPGEREGTQFSCDDRLCLDKEGLVNNNEKRTKIYKKLLDEQLLIQSYELVSKIKGANTPAIGKETLDGYSKDTIKQVIQKLKNHTFQFKPIRRVFIPKKDGSKRSLGIPGLRDKVVQKAAAILLEEIYENLFLKSSYGFRPRRGTHTALKQVTL